MQTKKLRIRGQEEKVLISLNVDSWLFSVELEHAPDFEFNYQKKDIIEQCQKTHVPTKSLLQIVKKKRVQTSQVKMIRSRIGQIWFWI